MIALISLRDTYLWCEGTGHLSYHVLCCFAPVDGVGQLEWKKRPVSLSMSVTLRAVIIIILMCKTKFSDINVAKCPIQYHKNES